MLRNINVNSQFRIQMNQKKRRQTKLHQKKYGGECVTILCVNFSQWDEVYSNYNLFSWGDVAFIICKRTSNITGKASPANEPWCEDVQSWIRSSVLSTTTTTTTITIRCRPNGNYNDLERNLKRRRRRKPKRAHKHTQTHNERWKSKSEFMRPFHNQIINKVQSLCFIFISPSSSSFWLISSSASDFQ